MALVSSAVLDLEMLLVLGYGVMCHPSPHLDTLWLSFRVNNHVA